LHVTTKSFNIRELNGRGARAVIFVNNAYSAETHRPIKTGPEERITLGGDVGFIGAFEKDRAQSLHFLASHGVHVRIWGSGWRRWAERNGHPNMVVEERHVWGEEYAKALCSFDINLGFLRRLNRDLQTTRSVEIPACGGFMLAERTAEHLGLFTEGIEAEFFSSKEELLEKCCYYLANREARDRIAAAGRERCIRSGYSYERQVEAVLDRLRGLRTRAE
jgi:spore maturation protein CgeB